MGIRGRSSGGSLGRDSSVPRKETRLRTARGNEPSHGAGEAELVTFVEAAGLAKAELRPWSDKDTRALFGALDLASGGGGDGKVELGDVKALFGPLVLGQSVAGPDDAH